MNLARALKNIPYLRQIASLAKKRKVNVWLVGGLLRDACLKIKKEFCDFDFCVEKDTKGLVKEFARAISAKVIVLDPEQQSLRVALKRKGKIYTYDFTRMRAKTIVEDLSLRDFSINTLAVNLCQPDKLLDYFGAKRDLKRKRIGVVNERTFCDDPLRILRGFSFEANYNFRISNKTKQLMTKHKRLLKNVSGERINEELFKIFSASFSYPVIKEMDAAGILGEIIPVINKARGVYQGRYHHLDVWKHSLETLRQFEFLNQRRLARNKTITSYLNQEFAYTRRRIQIIKLACLLHDIGKPAAKAVKDKKTIFHRHEKIGRDLASDIASALKLSVKETEVLKRLIFWHLRPGYLADQIKPPPRAIYRFFRDSGDEGAAIILLSLSDWRATRGPLTSPRKRRRHEEIMLRLISSYFKEQAKKPVVRLVDGYDIMRRFKLSPSPLVGKVLKKLNEEQTLGRISTKLEAYSIAKKIIGHKKRN